MTVGVHRSLQSLISLKACQINSIISKPVILFHLVHNTNFCIFFLFIIAGHL